ncbi:uncharacterized protein LOC144439683 isoform X2 [Glandiceps talaboti]
MAAVSKEEYLKRYMSKTDDEAKRKKKRKKDRGIDKRASVKIVDDDIAIHNIAPKVEDIEEAPFMDEAPQVAGIVDERPDEVIQLEQYRSEGRWKLIGKDGDAMSEDVLGRRKRHDSDSDQSPLRIQDHVVSPQRKSRHDSDWDSDLSPPRVKIETKTKRTRHDSSDSDSDLSPPRIKTEPAWSPVRKQNYKSYSDLSPPRTKKSGHKRALDSDQSPPRRRHDSNSDLSPPRKSRHEYDSDLSPPRKSSKFKFSSKSKYESDSDQSPPRKPSEGKQQERKPSKTLSGTKAGLSDAATLRRENEDRRRREKETFTRMTEEVSGRNAETVYRDREGHKRNLKMEKLKQREEEAKKMEEAEKYMEWGRGVAQTKQVKDNIADQMHEMAKPLARYKDDKDLDDMLKQRERDEDPMLAFLKKKQAKQAIKAGIKEKPRYKGPQPPPNRFNIWPGYRWDGVDRSNGFEKKWFQRMSDKKATSEIAYKWSTEDM